VERALLAKYYTGVIQKIHTSVGFIGRLILGIKRPGYGVVKHGFRKILEVADVVDLADVRIELPVTTLVMTGLPDCRGGKRKEVNLAWDPKSSGAHSVQELVRLYSQPRSN